MGAFSLIVVINLLNRWLTEGTKIQMPALSQSICCSCGETIAKYRCPGCTKTSCSLACVQKHKIETSCSGQRSITHFVPVAQFNDNDLISDYRFLEQVERSLYGKKKNRIVHSNQMYPVVVDFLRRGAFKRGVKLKFLSLGMQRRSTNSSMFNRRTDTLTWKVEWEFPLSEMTYSDKSVNDGSVIQTVLNNYLSNETSDVIRQSLKKYFVHIDQVRVLMANDLFGDQKRYYLVDPELTLSEFLLGKTIVEYPSFVVTLEPFLERYKIISKEEENQLREEMREKRLNRFFTGEKRQPNAPDENESLDSTVGSMSQLNESLDHLSAPSTEI